MFSLSKKRAKSKKELFLGKGRGYVRVTSLPFLFSHYSFDFVAQNSLKVSNIILSDLTRMYNFCRKRGFDEEYLERFRIAIAGECLLKGKLRC